MTYLPYYPARACLTDGHTSTFTRDHMAEVWDRLIAEEKINWLFYDGHVRDRQDYMDFMSSPDVYAYAAYTRDGKTLLATYWVNDFLGAAGKMHFCYFDAGIPHRYKLGIDTCHFLLRNGGLSALIGITPKPFRHAWRFALAVGFEKVATVPLACSLQTRHQPRLVDAIITLCTRKTLLPLPE